MGVPVGFEAFLRAKVGWILVLGADLAAEIGLLKAIDSSASVGSHSRVKGAGGDKRK